MKTSENDLIALLGLVADIRSAVGDPTGKLMQGELVEHCRKLRMVNTKRSESGDIIIEKIENGYLIRSGGALTEYCGDIQSLFRKLLIKLEHRCEWFGGESYGAVFVADKPGEKFEAPAEVNPA